MKWSDSLQQKIEGILAIAQETMSSVQDSSTHPQLNSDVLKTLWNNPIIYCESLQKKLHCDNTELSNVIEELVERKVIAPKKIKNTNQNTVYEATSIMHCWRTIDDLLFVEH